MAQPGQTIPAQAAIFAPDIYAQQMQLSRQQKIAEMLQTQGLEMPQGQMVSGHYVAPAATQHLARLASVLGGSYLNQQNDEKQLDLSRQYGQAMQGQVDNMLGGGAPTGMPSSNERIISQPDGVQPQFQSQQPGNQPAQQSPQMLQMRNAAKAAMMMGNQDLANKLIGNMLEMTNDQKNMAAMGQDPRLMGQLSVAKATKEGTQAVPDNGYLVLPNGKIMWGSDIKGGTYTATGPNGEPVSVPIQGANENAASRAGLIKRAELGATDTFATPQPVATKNGPIAMLPTQQRAAANGGTDPAFPRVTPQQQAERDVLRKKIVSDELADNPNDAALRKEATNIGIPLESDTDKQRQKTTVDIQSESLKALTKDADSMRGMVPVFDQLEKLIKQGTLGNSIGDRAEMLGHSSGLRQTDKTINTANLEKLGNQLVLSRGSLGAGVSVSDAERYDKAAGDFTKAQSNKEKLQYLGIMRDVIQGSYARANEGIAKFNKDGTLPAYSLPSSNGGIDALLKKYGG